MFDVLGILEDRRDFRAGIVSRSRQAMTLLEPCPYWMPGSATVLL